MPAYETALNSILDDFAGNAVYVSAHTSSTITDPTTPNEVSGGSYARQSITWNSASSSALDSSNQPAIPIPSGNNVQCIGFWNHVSNQTAAAFMGYITITAINFTADGTLTLTDVDWTAS